MYCLKLVKENQDEVFRKQLEQQIEELYGQISFKAYLPRLSDRYELSLVEVAGKQDVLVGASTGENQILSLSFIGSVVDEFGAPHLAIEIASTTLSDDLGRKRLLNEWLGIQEYLLQVFNM